MFLLDSVIVVSNLQIGYTMKNIKIDRNILIAFLAVLIAVPAAFALGSAQHSVPETCMTALDLADESQEIASDQFAVISDLFSAVVEDDYSTVGTDVARLDNLTTRAEPTLESYRDAARECRESN